MRNQFIGFLKKTDFLSTITDYKFNLSTRLCWIFNDKDLSNLKCNNQNCNKNVNYKIQLRIMDDFPKFCSYSCVNSTVETQLKIKATKKKRYGNENYVNIEKAKQTVETYANEDPLYWFKIEQKTKQTKVANGHDPNWNNREKSNKTHFEKKAADPTYVPQQVAKTKHTKFINHSNENFVNVEKAKETRYSKNNGQWESQETKIQRQKTFQENHDGLTSTFQLPGVYEKCVQRFQELFGVDSPLKSLEIRSKITDTWLNNYGVDNPWKAQEIIEKSLKTKIQKTGSIAVYKRYKYNGILFDSTWELALWIYCNDNNIAISKVQSLLLYEYAGKIHRYFPDFLIEGKLVEIKGNQFFKEDGTMCNPYDHTQDELYEAKHQCMLKNQVIILKYDDIIIYVMYVNEKYGENYLKKFAL